MSIKICLDAGHYGKYNRSPANVGYYESEMAWKLHIFLKTELERYGIEVITTRSKQASDRDLTARGKAADGCDLFLSLHSNAISSQTQHSTDRCEVIYPVSGKKKELAVELAAAIKSEMGLACSSRVYSRKGAKGDYYGVIRGAASVGVPGMILEHSFHDFKDGSDCPATWLLKADNLKSLAAAEAKVIAEHFGLSKQKQDAVSDSVYRIVAKELNVRKGAGVDYASVMTVERGEAFTIVETKKSADGGTWGRLKSGKGWINIGSAYCKRV